MHQVPMSKDHGASRGKPLQAESKGKVVATADKGLTGNITSTTTSSTPKSLTGEKLEKPQKVLPCPRCESMNTKFCYYNNYSLNQPRHFCRQCQRYWTVGGTLRNVPVGGGSRKKNRRGAPTEPYPRPGSAVAPGAIGPGTPLAMAGPGGVSPPMSFQQFLAHDVPGAFQFSQLPGFMPPVTAPFGAFPRVVDQSGQGSSIQYVAPLASKQEFPPMYGTGHAAAAVGGNYFSDLSAGSLPGSDQANVGVKTEFWGHMNMAQNAQSQPQPQLQPQLQPQPQPQPVWEHSQAKQSGSAGAPGEGSVEKAGEAAGAKYDSSMLLQLGLTSGAGTKVWSQAAPKSNNSSPPHGSSTIEEEGSTPANGYSTNGYEEGDAVSSMWAAQNMHDMQDILCSTL